MDRSESQQYLEYDIPMVSSDGEPHKLLTMVAVFSGFIVAVIVLLIVIGLIDCRKRNLPEGMAKEQNRRKSSIFTIFAQKQTLGITVLTDVERRDDNISYKSGSVDNITASTAHILNERTNQSISETMFSNKLPGISTISC